MISLVNVHKEMNNKVTQDIASIAFENWQTEHLSIGDRALKRAINSALGSKKSTKHRKLAVEALLMIKLETLMKEVTNLTGDYLLGRCDECRGYYRIEVLEICDMCECTICAACSTLDNDFDMRFCACCRCH
jgi:hypothetical protein